jgi:hypothetical protein
VGEKRRLVVADVARTDDDPDLTSCLERVDLLDTALGGCELLERLETLDRTARDSRRRAPGRLAETASAAISKTASTVWGCFS